MDTALPMHAKRFVGCNTPLGNYCVRKLRYYKKGHRTETPAMIFFVHRAKKCVTMWWGGKGRCDRVSRIRGHDYIKRRRFVARAFSAFCIKQTHIKKMVFAFWSHCNSQEPLHLIAMRRNAQSIKKRKVMILVHFVFGVLANIPNAKLIQIAALSKLLRPQQI